MEKLADFAGKKSKFAEKSADFAGFSREKSQISKDFQGQILRKSGRFHGKCIWKYFWRISQKYLNYQKPCSNKFLSKGKMYSNPYNLFIHEVGLGDKKNEN